MVGGSKEPGKTISLYLGTVSHGPVRFWLRQPGAKVGEVGSLRSIGCLKGFGVTVRSVAKVKEMLLLVGFIGGNGVIGAERVL